MLSGAAVERVGNNQVRTGRIFCFFIVAGLALGCGSSRSAGLSAAVRGSRAPVGHLALTNRNGERLAALWAARRGKRPEFPIGSGDVLQVSVPGLHEFRERTVRVTEDGDISLPLLGTMHVAGLSEDGVREKLVKRLGEYMYHPQVDLFVKTFSSRQAAVLGEVRTPGMYTLNGPADTIREMIQRAGGIRHTGAQEVLLTPAALTTAGEGAETGSSDRTSVRNVGFTEPALPSAGANAAGKTNEASLGTGSAHRLFYHDGALTPLVIDLSPGSHDERYMEMPVIPGDTIYVPRAGDVTVVGWVYTPKVIPITPGLTVFGAVSAAGGPLYAADMTSVKVFRQDGKGRPMVIKVNLDKVKEREAPDMPVQANDVVQVGYSTLRIPGYAVYYAMQGIFMWAPITMVTAGVP